MYTGDDDERPEQRTASGSATGNRGTDPTPSDAGGHDRGSRQERSSPRDPDPRDTPLTPKRDPARYELADEPLQPDDPVDWRYLYSLVLERVERAEDRGKTLDAKVTSLLGGVVAFIGFSFRGNVPGWSAAAALLYIIPLGFLFSAFLIQRGETAPTANALRRYFPAFPVSALKDGIDAMLIVDARNRAVNQVKAARVDLATIMTGIVTAVILITQFVLSWQIHDVGAGGVQARPALSVPAGSRPTVPARHP